ncbi:MAG: ISAs1 family transposase [Planctomycetaceae bacterium]
MPSHDTFGRVFARLDTGEFLTAMHQWVDQFAGSLRDRGIAIDGKTLKGSFDRAADQSPLHTITAFATDTRLVLRQLSVDEKSNEIPAVPVLLTLLELEGAVVTLDAMHTQVETARAIIQAKADYVMTVKQNQPQLHQRLTELFEQYAQQDYQVDCLRQQISKQQALARPHRTAVLLRHRRTERRPGALAGRRCNRSGCSTGTARPPTSRAKRKSRMMWRSSSAACRPASGG